jgi:hypothetical protein
MNPGYCHVILLEVQSMSMQFQKNNRTQSLCYMSAFAPCLWKRTNTANSQAPSLSQPLIGLMHTCSCTLSQMAPRTQNLTEQVPETHQTAQQQLPLPTQRGMSLPHSPKQTPHSLVAASRCYRNTKPASLSLHKPCQSVLLDHDRLMPRRLQRMLLHHSASFQSWVEFRDCRQLSCISASRGGTRSSSRCR